MGTIDEIIEEDLKISVDEIRNTEWKTLEKRPRNILKLPFRPRDAFQISGNINLALHRDMGKLMLRIRECKRNICYRLNPKRNKRNIIIDLGEYVLDHNVMPVPTYSKSKEKRNIIHPKGVIFK